MQRIQPTKIGDARLMRYPDIRNSSNCKKEILTLGPYPICNDCFAKERKSN